MASQADDLDYYIQADSDYPNPSIEVVKPCKIVKKETDPMSGQQFGRIQNVFNLQPSEDSNYIKSTGHSSNSRQHAIKYENSRMMTLVKTEDNVDEYIIHNTSHTNSSSLKSKPHSSTHTVQSSISRRRKTDKAGKGLRHFSMKVCEKVREKGKTTYNEVADELVAEEVRNFNSYDSGNCDQKNIRRRVYDALNVLMAMNIISKHKKEIRWIGLPTNSAQQCSTIEAENDKRRERILTKEQELKELIFQQVSFKNLVERNKDAEQQAIIPAPNSAIQLPFIIVNTHKTTKVNCSVSPDKSEYYFTFSDKFEIHDDVEVLKQMGLLLGLDKGECTYENIEKAKSLVPKSFEKHIEVYGQGHNDSHLTDDYDIQYAMDIRTPEQSSDQYEIEDRELSEMSDID